MLSNGCVKFGTYGFGGASRDTRADGWTTILVFLPLVDFEYSAACSLPFALISKTGPISGAWKSREFSVRATAEFPGWAATLELLFFLCPCLFFFLLCLYECLCTRSKYLPLTVLWLCCLTMIFVIWFLFKHCLVLFPVAIPSCFHLVCLGLSISLLLRRHDNPSVFNVTLYLIASSHVIPFLFNEVKIFYIVFALYVCLLPIWLLLFLCVVQLCHMTATMLRFVLWSEPFWRLQTFLCFVCLFTLCNALLKEPPRFK